MKAYIIGRMRGKHRYNYAAFDAAEHKLSQLGWETINPHREDLKAGFNVSTYNPHEHRLSWDDYPPPELFDVEACRSRCERSVEEADAIFILKGGLGEGGLRELEHAILMGKDIHYEQDGYPMIRGKATERPEKPITPEEADARAGKASDAEKSPDPAKEPPRAGVLSEAKTLVCGDRNAAYGPPTQDFQRTADLWTTLMANKLKDGETIKPADVAWMMVLLKASRARHSPKRDNYVDAAGYAACGWECEQEAGA